MPPSVLLLRSSFTSLHCIKERKRALSVIRILLNLHLLVSAQQCISTIILLYIINLLYVVTILDCFLCVDEISVSEIYSKPFIKL